MCVCVCVCVCVCGEIQERERESRELEELQNSDLGRICKTSHPPYHPARCILRMTRVKQLGLGPDAAAH